tara:strand:- start:5873 stop:6205 length:333 start_codon:yes stop_codon:yes gene_type:complete
MSQTEECLFVPSALRAKNAAKEELFEASELLATTDIRLCVGCAANTTLCVAGGNGGKLEEGVLDPTSIREKTPLREFTVNVRTALRADPVVRDRTPANNTTDPPSGNPPT